MSDEVYSAPALQTPSVKKLRESAERWGLDLTDDQLQEYADEIGCIVPAYTFIDGLPEPTLPVKYPRLPGYRPDKEENPHNAWSWRTDIKGAGSGVLSGKTVALKDNIAVAGVPMVNGSRVLEGYIPEFDAELVTRILDAGGTIAGKAASEDLCLSAGSFTPCSGPVLNSVNTEYDAGGSSSGSAALVASGAVDVAIGGEQGGSVRMPASRCGIVGMKPSYGLIPYSGVINYEPTLDHVGPFGKTVTDVALLLEAVAGPDGRDFRQANLPGNLDKTFSKQLTGNIKGMKIGILREAFDWGDGEINQVVRKAIEKFKDCGANVEEVSIPQHQQTHLTWSPQIISGAYNNLIRGGGVGVSYRGYHPTTLAEHMRRGYKMAANDLSTSVKMIIMLGDYIDHEYGNKFHHKAVNLVPVFRQAYNRALSEYTVLAMPTMVVPTEKLITHKQATNVKEFLRRALGREHANTTPFCTTGLPAISLNAGYSAAGLPIGIQLVAAMYDDARLLNVAYALEQQLRI